MSKKEKKRKNSKQFNERFRKKIFSKSIIFVIAVALILCAGIAVACYKIEINSKQYQAQIDELNTEIANLESTNKSLEDELKNRDSDEYIEKIAREHLGMIKKGEFSLKESKGSNSDDSSSSTTEEKK